MCVFRKLEQELITCENEKMVLQNKLQDIENNGYTKACVSNTTKTKESYSNSIKISKGEVKYTDQMGVKNDTKSLETSCMLEVTKYIFILHILYSVIL